MTWTECHSYPKGVVYLRKLEVFKTGLAAVKLIATDLACRAQEFIFSKPIFSLWVVFVFAFVFLLSLYMLSAFCFESTLSLLQAKQVSVFFYICCRRL